MPSISKLIFSVKQIVEIFCYVGTLVTLTFDIVKLLCHLRSPCFVKVNTLFICINLSP